MFFEHFFRSRSLPARHGGQRILVHVLGFPANVELGELRGSVERLLVRGGVVALVLQRHVWWWLVPLVWRRLEGLGRRRGIGVFGLAVSTTATAAGEAVAAAREAAAKAAGAAPEDGDEDYGYDDDANDDGPSEKGGGQVSDGVLGW